MKKYIFLLSISLLSLFSCDMIKDNITVPVNTSLSVDVSDIDVVEMDDPQGLVNTNKAGKIYKFTKTKEYKLDENFDIQQYLQKIRSVNLKAIKIAINTLIAPQEVLTFDVYVTGITGPVLSSKNLTPSNNSFSPVITPAIQAQLSLLEARLLADRKITVTISGTTNPYVKKFSVRLDFDARFVCNPLD